MGAKPTLARLRGKCAGPADGPTEVSIYADIYHEDRHESIRDTGRNTLFALTDTLFSAMFSSILALAILYSWKWARASYRFLVSALTTFLGFAAWNILQSSTGADLALNIDWPIFPLSWSDVGSGVSAFVVTVIVLGLITAREELSWRVVMASGLAGLSALLVDLFAL
jgi:hypothetical protein